MVRIVIKSLNIKNTQHRKSHIRTSQRKYATLLMNGLLLLRISVLFFFLFCSYCTFRYVLSFTCHSDEGDA